MYSIVWDHNDRSHGYLVYWWPGGGDCLCGWLGWSLELFNTLRQKQNGRRFPDDTFKCIFSNENVRISMKISLKFVPKVPINNIPALIQIMAWAGQATSHYLNQCWLVYWRIYASLGLNELNMHVAVTHFRAPLTHKMAWNRNALDTG